jgi:hypothetical protein
MLQDVMLDLAQHLPVTETVDDCHGRIGSKADSAELLIFCSRLIEGSE